MLKGSGEERDGALLRRLRDAGHGGKASAFGFVTGAEGSARRRPMVVVARVTGGAGLAGEVQALAESGVDGIEVALRRDSDAGAVAAAIGAVSVPCGVYVSGEGAVSSVEGIAGIDWIHLASDAPAALLAGKGPTRLISLSPDLPSGRLPGLAGLKADIAVIDVAQARLALTVETLLALRTIQMAVQGPVLVADGRGIAPGDVQVLHDHGVEGVLLTGGAAEAQAFIAAIDGL